MGDLLLGLAVMAALSLGAFGLAVRFAAGMSPRKSDRLALLAFAGLVLYIAVLWDQPLLATLLPFSNLIVVGNWFPIATGFLAGLVWNRFPDRRLRTWLSTVALLSVGFYSVLHPLRGRAPECDDLWAGPVCLQTSPYTCSPASAASLLRAHGVSAAEQEMAELCLTRRGTTWTGLYRGLKKKTAGTEYEVEVFECSLDELRRYARQGPVILSVTLEESAARTHEVYVRECGWVPGQAHSVVLYKFVGEGVIVGDPSQGREVWPATDLDVLWHGQGMRLVARPLPPRL